MKIPGYSNTGAGSVPSYAIVAVAVAAVAIAIAVVLRSGSTATPVAADAIAAPASAPASGGFIKLGDIKGESTDEAHKDWINLLSISQSITRPGGGISGSTRQRGAATFGDIVVVKEIDKSTPKLQESIASGQVFPTLELELTAPYGGSRATYLRYELKNVIVTSYRVSGSTGDDTVPVETFTLNFEEIKVTYTENDSAGKSQGNVEYSWKVEEGTN